MITIGGRRYKRKTLIWLVCGILGAILLVGVIRAGNGDAPPPEPAPIVLNNGKVTGNRIVSKSWSLDYKSITTSPDGVAVTVEDVRSGLFYKEGKPYMTFHASHAVGNTVSHNLTITGGVHLETLSGAVKHTFDTDYVDWNNGTQVLDIPHLVTIHSDEDVLRVSSIAINFTTGQTTIKGVHGAIRH